MTELYFTLNGTVFLPGATVLITDIGTFASPTPEGAANSLVCVTSNVNTQCCRTSDGGSVGDWFFPNGTIVPRNGENRFADFTRSAFMHQVRLNRRSNAVMPTGNFSCRVPQHVEIDMPEHVAVITLITGGFIAQVCLQHKSVALQNDANASMPNITRNSSWCCP